MSLLRRWARRRCSVVSEQTSSTARNRHPWAEAVSSHRRRVTGSGLTLDQDLTARGQDVSGDGGSHVVASASGHAGKHLTTVPQSLLNSVNAQPGRRPALRLRLGPQAQDLPADGGLADCR